MRAVYSCLAVLLLGLAACTRPEPPIISGGPTTSEAIRAVLNNPRILPQDAVASELRNVRLDATHCSVLPRGEVSCNVRLYSLGRGWSAVTPGRFVKEDETWSFAF